MRQIDMEPITEEQVDAALLLIKKRMMAKIKSGQTAKFPFVSISEALGKITEEYYEALQAAHSKNIKEFKSEATDLSVACIRLLISDSKNVKKKEP